MAWVPGAFEIPLVAQKMASSKVRCRNLPWCCYQRLNSSFRLCCREMSKVLQKVSLDSGIPVIFGVLTTDTIEQAIERAGTKTGNKGYDAAVTAIEMANLLKQL